MPVDGGLVVGYLTAALVRAGRRWGNRALDLRLDRLTDAIARRLGIEPVDRLAGNPRDEHLQRLLGTTIDRVMSHDRAFARELTRLTAELDRCGGRRVLNQVYAQLNVQAFDGGVAIGRDFNYFHAPDPGDLSDAPGWVKVCLVVGSIVAVSGMLIFGYTFFAEMPDLNDPNFGQTPPGIPLAFGVFFAGFVVFGIGVMGRALSRRR